MNMLKRTGEGQVKATSFFHIFIGVCAFTISFIHFP